MWLKGKISDLSEELAKPLKETDAIIRSYLSGVSLIVQDIARDERYCDNHLSSYLAQDFLESAISIVSLSMEGPIRAPNANCHSL
jgi:hypothetical protein